MLVHFAGKTRLFVAEISRTGCQAEHRHVPSEAGQKPFRGNSAFRNTADFSKRVFRC